MYGPYVVFMFFQTMIILCDYDYVVARDISNMMLTGNYYFNLYRNDVYNFGTYPRYYFIIFKFMIDINIQLLN